MKKNFTKVVSLGILVSATFAASFAHADCGAVSRAAFESAANQAAVETNAYGFGLPMWATMVNENGRVCHVYSVKSDGTSNAGAYAGNKAWMGSRVISAQKANTATDFSLDNLAISTGGVYAAVQPGGSLYGLQHSNPVDAAAAYSQKDGSGVQRGPADYGSANDPMMGKFVGGVNVFGGGVALYNVSTIKIGALGVSGDTSCRDHVFAWRMRVHLQMDNTPNSDALTFVTTPPANLFESPACGVSDLETVPNAAYGIGGVI